MTRLTRIASLSPGAAAVGLALFASAAAAGTTRSFKQTSAKDFEEGEATASMILPSGEVSAGMKTGRVPLDAAFAWCAALSRDRRTAYFGTGDQGRIFTVPVAPPAGAEPAARKLADLDAAWITSLVARDDGTLLAGATPGGRVFAINTATGGVRSLAKVAGEHIWALVADAKPGTIYAATGGPGKVFAIDDKGAVSLLWDSGDKHVVALANGGGGTLLAGTSDEAILYRIYPDGRAIALHDFEADEVRAVVRTGTVTYIAVNDFEKSTDLAGTLAAGSAAAAARGTRITPGPAAPASAGIVARPGQVKSKGAVYKLEDSGRIEQIFAVSDGYFTSLIVDGAGDVYVATGTQGKLYRISSDLRVALAADLPERQALSLVRTDEGFLVGTGDVGGVYRVRPAAQGEASYLSRVFDADGPAVWGRLHWAGTAGLAFETRSGNTSKPDRSWSDWRPLANAAFSGGEGEGRVASNGSRYLQYRVSMPGKGALLREATLYYLPQNQRARVIEVSLADGPSASSPLAPAALSLPSTAAPRAHSPVLKLRWRVDNPDGDELIYRLWFRQERESIWRPLGGPEPLPKPEYDWNTESVPDGEYVVKVWASDEKVTPRERALDFNFVSSPLLVDNTRPEILDLHARGPVVTGRVRDAASVISQIEAQVDGGDWRPVAPTDLLLDQRTESFSLTLTDLTPGPHIVTVRAFDAADNVGSARLQVQIGR